MEQRWLARFLLCVAIVATLSVPALAHQGLKTGLYECWTTGNGTYANLDLKLRSRGRYVWQLHDESWKRNGTFERNGDRLRFTGGFLKNRNFKGLLHAYNDSFGYHTHVVYLYKNNYTKENQKYDCNNN